MNAIPEVTVEEFTVLSKMLAVGTHNAQRGRGTFIGLLNRDLPESESNSRERELLSGLAERKLCFRYEQPGAYWCLTSLGCDVVRAGKPVQRAAQ